ncbi:hypothetical protein BU23DRAFT_632440 [Bimuria novae-zelandiae CBS 107.79]|uniref:Uncharacterized protein n=1 Tax=Bimuria novae-zelandiae CBS 107.79 TaxID=1447943 RepID=A0A6A5VEZ0_9PLEO|nr:hypothetical protein BU23DRAFT_632440 [Bimuria novae-zelandiae CBS 107.79]
MAGGRVRQVLLTIFRVIQFILSLVALVFGIYITYVYYDMAQSASALLEVIDTLDPENDGVEILQHSLVPVLRHLDGTPARAITIFVSALCSTISIIYLFFANRAAQKHYRPLTRNSRKIRVLLSLLNLILWIAAIACSALLVVEFGIFAITVGPETKIALTTTEKIILEALKQALTSIDVVDNALNIVGSIMTVGFMAIVLLGSSITCAKVALVDCIVECCMSGKVRGQQGVEQAEAVEEAEAVEKGGAQVVTTPV